MNPDSSAAYSQRKKDEIIFYGSFTFSSENEYAYRATATLVRVRALSVRLSVDSSSRSGLLAGFPDNAAPAPRRRRHLARTSRKAKLLVG
jgi:hypothetical protein